MIASIVVNKEMVYIPILLDPLAPFQSGQRYLMNQAVDLAPSPETLDKLIDKFTDYIRPAVVPLYGGVIPTTWQVSVYRRYITFDQGPTPSSQKMVHRR